VTTASYTALPLATLTLTARVHPAPPAAGPASDRTEQRSGIQEDLREEQPR
jgi:hypothetical protein